MIQTTYRINVRYATLAFPHHRDNVPNLGNVVGLYRRMFRNRAMSYEDPIFKVDMILFRRGTNRFHKLQRRSHSISSSTLCYV